jgi:hypothetical protein
VKNRRDGRRNFGGKSRDIVFDSIDVYDCELFLIVLTQSPWQRWSEVKNIRDLHYVRFCRAVNRFGRGARDKWGFITESLKYFSTPSTRCPSPAIKRANPQLNTHKHGSHKEDICAMQGRRKSKHCALNSARLVNSPYLASSCDLCHRRISDTRGDCRYPAWNGSWRCR